MPVVYQVVGFDRGDSFILPCLVRLLAIRVDGQV